MLPSTFIDTSLTVTELVTAKTTGADYERSEYSKVLYERTRGITTVDKVELFTNQRLPAGWKLVKPSQPYDLFRLLYTRNPLVANSLNNTVDFAIQSGYQFEADQQSDIKNVENFYDEYDFEPICKNIMLLMMLHGNAFMELGGIGENGEGKIQSVKILPTDQMRVAVSDSAEDNGKIVGYVQLINDQKVITWTPEQVVHFKWNEIENSFYGISDLSCLLSDLTRLENYKEDLGIILHRYANLIVHWAVGTEDQPGTQAQVDDFASTVENREVGEDVITTGNIKANVLTPNIKMVQPDGLIRLLENQIIAGLRVPEIFVRGGISSNKATADVEAQMFDRKVKALRQSYSSQLEKKVFPKVTRGKVRKEWNELTIEGKLVQAQTLAALVGSTMPLTTSMEIVGWSSYIDEMKSEREEEQQMQLDRMEAEQDILPQPVQPGKKAPKSQSKSAKEYLMEEGLLVEEKKEDVLDQYEEEYVKPKFGKSD